MKKILLFVLMVVTAVSVNASSVNKSNNIRLENVEMIIDEKIGYNDKVEVIYSINPKDATNTKLVWNVVGLKKGVSVKFLSNRETTSVEGKIVIKVENNTDKDVKLTLSANQNNKIISSSKLVVENKDKTIKRVTLEATNLINGLSDGVNKSNYESNKYLIEKLDELFENDSNLKELIDDDMVQKYEDMKYEVDNYKSTSQVFVTAVSIILVVVFSIFMFWVFKKEEEE